MYSINNNEKLIQINCKKACIFKENAKIEKF